MNIKTSVLVVFLLAASWVNASELVYTPINPSFGGNPLNGNFLLGKAQAQNKHKAKLNKKSYAEKFQESLERAYINKMVREITDLAFGETCDVATDTECDPSIFNEDSIFTSGDYLIEIITSNTDSITVQITNSLTGEITLIEVPRFG
ncbi:curli assembly protein CsgF [Colwellia sp. KU-HH00111]|uniref:curli assembly protein CsgF n=1 Tax=Colwellia sp. KU-HH00111 TaxID=3127652 RepID=UPI0033659BAE